MDLENLIYDGPVEVKSAFEKMLNGSPKANHSKTKFIEFATLLNSMRLNKKESGFKFFLTAYFNQNAGVHCSDEDRRRNLFEESLNDYQAFQSNGLKTGIDIRYFAQWQIGVLQQALKKGTFLAEESLLKTMEYDPARGEAIREIIVTYSKDKNWPIANIYSSYCVLKLLGKAPMNRKWFIDFPFYKWKILKYHFIILMNLNKVEEAKEYAHELFARSLSIKDLSASEMNEISRLKKSWQEIL
jgi:hypothetical protein